MINVLHVVDKLTLGGSTIHGVTRLLSLWTPRFDKNLYNVSVCSLRRRDKAGDYLERNGVKVFYLSKGKYNPLTLASLIRLVKDEEVDVLHLHGYGAWTFGRPVGLLCGIPTIVHEHMVDVNIPIYQRLADRILSRTTTHAIAVSNAVADFMVQYRGVREDQVEVVVNGIPQESFRFQDYNDQKVSEEEWRIRIDIPNSHKVVGTVGRLDNIKGHRYFLEAAREVHKEFPNVTFIIVGDGELRESLEEMARTFEIEKSVRFTGHCEDVTPLYTLMDIMVIASLYEGGPLTLFEAMAAECAIVSTNTIGLKDVIEEGRTGFLVPARDAATIADRIILLLQDESRLRNMKAAACQRSEQFDITATIKKLENCYHRVLGG